MCKFIDLKEFVGVLKMNILNKLKEYKGYLDRPNKDALLKSISNCHADGIFSLVINGTDDGNLTRVFIATKDLNPGAVQYHTHRYDLLLTPITKTIVHHDAVIGDNIFSDNYINLYEYHSFLNGGNGLKFIRTTKVELTNYNMVQGTVLQLDHTKFHTMSCKKGDIWIVEEQGFKSDSSLVLGTPFITEGLYIAPLQYQINDMCQLVLLKLNELISSFEMASTS